MQHAGQKIVNHYKILGIKRHATEREIKRAYRKLVLLYHPDKLGDNSEQLYLFRKIQEAYNTLVNTELKQSYDQKFDRKTAQEKERQFSSYYSPENLILSIGVRTLVEGVPFKLIIQSFAGHQSIRINGNPGFRIIDGPLIKKVNEQITEITYRVLPLYRGKSILGPASVVYGDKKLVSSAIMMVVNRPPTKKELMNDRLFQRIIASIALVFLAVYITIVAYNYIKYDVIMHDNFAYNREVYMHQFRPENGNNPYEAYLQLPAVSHNYSNRIEFEGLSVQDAVVFLYNSDKEAIERIKYIRANENDSMGQLPDGNYYLIVYAGRFWDPNQITINDLPGAFKNRVALTSYDIESYRIVLEQKKETDNTYSHSIYKVPLQKLYNGIALKRINVF